MSAIVNSRAVLAGTALLKKLPIKKIDPLMMGVTAVLSRPDEEVMVLVPVVGVYPEKVN